jgi:hypothetical protein
MPRQKLGLTKADYSRRYREQRRAAGVRDMLVHIPEETAAYLDEVKARLGLSSRSDAVLLLIEKTRREATQQVA